MSMEDKTYLLEYHYHIDTPSLENIKNHTII